MAERQRFLSNALPALHAFLDEHAVWHCLTFGTLLGAVRDSRIIEWDHDIDLLIRPTDASALIALDDDEFSFSPYVFPGSSLALNPGDIAEFETGTLSVSWHGRTLGELWAFTLFNDGVLRCIDLDQGAYFWPHSSFPHYAVEELSGVELDGATYPAPRDPERWLEWIYGADWRTPYRATSDSGRPRDDTGSSGDRTAPHLAARRDWCMERGWQPDTYGGEPTWPRPLHAAGPFGAKPERAARTSGSDWWHSLDELAANY